MYQPTPPPQPILVDDNNTGAPVPAPAPRAKRPRCVASQAISRTPRVHPAGHEDHAHIITPSRIITDSGGRPGPALDPHIQQPIITPTHIGGPIITPSWIIGSPVITPSRIIHSGSGSRALSIHSQPSVTPITHPPPDPMSEDKTRDEEPPCGSTSDNKAYSVYGSMDGFIQPPPPRGLPSITIPSEDRELPQLTHKLPQLPTAEPLSIAKLLPSPNPCKHQQQYTIPPKPQLHMSTLLPPQPQPQPHLAKYSEQPITHWWNLQLARQLFNAPERSHWSLTVVMWMTQRRAAALPAAPVAANDPSAPNDLRDPHAKHTGIIQPGPISTRAHLCAFSTAPNTTFRRQHLPAGIPENNKSMAGLVTFLQSMVKHERTHMRNLDLNTGVIVRIAMLQLLTVHHLIHRAPGDTRSQWDLINNQLESVRQKSDVELQA
ncbi:hypothetical protein PtA15_9A35 [Puccinia triticina]|uniref:Uncharacterized protein n=1 Tax=Puccinia triticina TaxID=208348 RepID=A0ABY7CUX7_9BASI|nr:uncharacterized protein PtA15_9A35 [Puccinia triticina]WAQ87911.1 hypothetical protein PtA15_9A35 [Puccinia triticina]